MSYYMILGVVVYQSAKQIQKSESAELLIQKTNYKIAEPMGLIDRLASLEQQFYECLRQNRKYLSY